VQSFVECKVSLADGSPRVQRVGPGTRGEGTVRRFKSKGKLFCLQLKFKEIFASRLVFQQQRINNLNFIIATLIYAGCLLAPNNLYCYEWNQFSSVQRVIFIYIHTHVSWQSARIKMAMGRTVKLLEEIKSGLGWGQARPSLTGGKSDQCCTVGC
jgi:hypothetical protein